MLLKDWMAANGVSDVHMAAAVGGVSAELIRKLRFQACGASIRTAARIDIVTRGAVRSPDLIPLKRRAGSAPTEARP